MMSSISRKRKLDPIGYEVEQAKLRREQRQLRVWNDGRRTTRVRARLASAHWLDAATC